MAQLTRSPYYYSPNTADSSAATVTLTIKIWNGVKASPIASPQYTLSKSVTVPATGNRYATFEISELIRDYIEVTFDGGYATDVVWAALAYTIYNSSGGFITGGGGTILFLDGYGYFEEGSNPQPPDRTLIDNRVIWRPEDENIRIPVLADETDATDVVMVSNGQPVRTETLAASTTASDMIKDASVSGDISADNYKQRVLSVGGTFENNPLLWDIDNYVDINLVDEIRVYRDGTYDKIKVRTMECNKYPNRKITFLNKNGAFQDIYFFGRETDSTETTSERYKANVINLQTASYSTTAHQYQQYDKQGKNKVVLNTGFVSEDYNEVIKQLLFSEKVWLTKTTNDESTIYPVIPLTKSVSYKTSLNERMVEYAVEFEYAFDAVQNIR